MRLVKPQLSHNPHKRLHLKRPTRHLRHHSIPPTRALQSTQTDPFLLLSQAHSKIPKEAHTILMGDFNAHTDHDNGPTPHLHQEIIQHLQHESQHIEPPKRKSLDHRKIDSYNSYNVKYRYTLRFTITSYGCESLLYHGKNCTSN